VQRQDDPLSGGRAQAAAPASAVAAPAAPSVSAQATAARNSSESKS
jgi:hypothetical protein